jgi:hypothetical protein
MAYWILTLREPAGYLLDCSVVGSRADAEAVRRALFDAPRAIGRPVEMGAARWALARAGYWLRRFHVDPMLKVIRAHIRRRPRDRGPGVA